MFHSNISAFFKALGIARKLLLKGFSALTVSRARNNLLSEIKSWNFWRSVWDHATRQSWLFNRWLFVQLGNFNDLMVEKGFCLFDCLMIKYFTFWSQMALAWVRHRRTWCRAALKTSLFLFLFSSSFYFCFYYWHHGVGQLWKHHGIRIVIRMKRRLMILTRMKLKTSFFGNHNG